MVKQAIRPATELTTQALRDAYRSVRDFSQTICQPLEPEDCVIQSMPDVSPTRWHLAHTTWFFETFVLQQVESKFKRFNEAFEVLFNSYYNSVGQQFPRPKRGLLSRPTVREVFDYRRNVDERMGVLFEDEIDPALLKVIELGLHHEQQHQELMLTDIKHVFSCNPLFPVYRERGSNEDTACNSARPVAPIRWLTFDGGVHECGREPADGQFGFDNEFPRHRVALNDYALSDRLVTCGEYLEFIEDGGYRRPELWLSLGWSWVNEGSHEGPLYWYQQDGKRWVFTLSGLRPLQPEEPVCHLSYFEADAYARWAGVRLPTEFEWEVATRVASLDSQAANFADEQRFHPVAATVHLPESDGNGQPSGSSSPHDQSAAVRQMLGDVWEWTSSAYAAYPGYRPPSGALGEYNGKFMCNQFVLRGGSCATSRDHIRTTYRNFFPPDACWQFTGLRLAREC